MRTPRQQVAVAAALLVLVGALLRAPALALPLGQDDAVLAVAAERFAAGEVPALEGRGPVVPALVALPVACGVDATTALRVLALLAGALAPALLLLVGRRLGFSPLRAALAGLLLALQPLWVAHAGGAEAGTWGTGVALALAGMLAGRFALAVALLPPLAEPALWPLLVVAFAVVLAAPSFGPGDRRAWLAGVAAAGVAAVLLGRGVATSSPWALAVGLVVSCGAPLAVALPRGVRALWRASAGPPGLARGVVVATALQVVLAALGLDGVGLTLGWDGLGSLAPAAFGVALCLAAGLRVPEHAADRRLTSGALGLLLAGTLWMALGPSQHALAGEGAPLAGRLHALGAAVRLAAREAGPEGWVALDLGDGTATQARALASFTAGRPVLVTPASGGASPEPPGWPPGGPITLALVTVRPDVGPVTTLGGYGIYAQEPAGRFGAYHVQRVRRP